MSADLTGQVFGRLTLTSLAEIHTTPNGTKKYKWSWVCACGSTGASASSDLRSGRTRSCGCLQRETAARLASIDISAQRFGRLTAIRRAEGSRWLCRCECGSEVVVTTNALTSGNTSSCGCLRGGATSWKWTLHPSYSTVHFRIRRSIGSASSYPCVDCGRPARDWSYDGRDENELSQMIDGHRRRYSADPSHYTPRCRSCHKDYDNSLRAEVAS